MKESDRLDRWVADLRMTLGRAEELVARGEGSYREDPAMPLAFEALSNRVGELSKRLIAADPAKFASGIWRQAARNRDFVVHHYDRIDDELLWRTVAVSFPLLRAALDDAAPDEE